MQPGVHDKRTLRPPKPREGKPHGHMPQWTLHTNKVAGLLCLLYGHGLSIAWLFHAGWVLIQDPSTVWEQHTARGAGDAPHSVSVISSLQHGPAPGNRLGSRDCPGDKRVKDRGAPPRVHRKAPLTISPVSTVALLGG